jgi:hypothetical protein
LFWGNGIAATLVPDEPPLDAPPLPLDAPPEPLLGLPPLPSVV